jgi:hypothetical protein
VDRILPWVALIIAAAVATVAVVELDSRSTDDIAAIEPTTVPSPSELATPPEVTEDSAQATEEPTEEPTEAPASAAAPEPSKTATPEPTVESEPTPTVEPPSTPSPEPPLAAGPIDTSNGKTPHTGGSSLVPGLLIALCALAMRAILVQKGRLTAHPERSRS